MRFIFVSMAILGCLAVTGLANVIIRDTRLICYFDSKAFSRESSGKLVIQDLDPALELCTDLVYGYAGIDQSTFKLKSLNESLDLDKEKGQFKMITSLKRKFPHLKVILGVGGDADVTPGEEATKYLNLLESSTGRIAFVNSAHSMVKNYGFDGLDLAWQFPKNKPKKIHSSIGGAWKSFKKTFTGDSVVDEKAAEHKDQFTALVRELRNAFRADNFILGMTVLPNVNTTYFFDIPAIINNLDFVNLFAFDFQTPDRNNKEADYPARLHDITDRNPETNVNFQVQLWLNAHTPAKKIIVGVPSYGRAWIMSKNSGITGHPPVAETKGPAEAGLTPGLLSYPEICARLQNPSNTNLNGADAPLRKVEDPTKRFGPYAYRIPDNSGDHGLWVGYEDPKSMDSKAAFVRTKGLGGLAFYELSLDDFRGSCNEGKYPLLRGIKYPM